MHTHALVRVTFSFARSLNDPRTRWLNDPMTQSESMAQWLHHLAIRTQILVPEGTLAPAAGFCSAARPLPTILRSRPNFSHSKATRRVAQPEKSGTVTSGPSPSTTELEVKSPLAGCGSARTQPGQSRLVNDAVFTGEVAAPNEFRSEGRYPAKSSCFWSGAFTGLGVMIRGQREGLS